MSLEDQLDEAQSGFRKDRSTQDHIITIKQMIEKTRVTKTEIYLAFLDLEKAFDTVSQNEICESLKSRNVNENLIQAIRSLNTNNKCYIRKDNMHSDTFPINSGLRQGGVLSPTLFILIVHDIKP